MASNVPAPSVHLNSFACPNCGAHASQFWYDVRLESITSQTGIPILGTVAHAEEFERIAETGTSDPTQKAALARAAQSFRRAATGEVFVDHDDRDQAQRRARLANVFVSQCYTCKRVAIWRHDQLMLPAAMTAPPPSEHLPQAALPDYDEARRVLDISPRSAAALLRLAIEKICDELSAGGGRLDQKIGNLVAKGLPIEVQQALDAVRVIGNNAVHAGQMDLRDDRDTASRLFEVVNFIAEDRIGRPKRVQALYEMLPPASRAAIDRRDAKGTDEKNP